MPAQRPPLILLASPDPALLSRVEVTLLNAGRRVEIALSAEAALAALQRLDPPDLALLDEQLPGMEPARLLAAARAQCGRFPILLIAGAVSENSFDWLAEGAIDDVILRADEAAYWEIRTERAMRSHRLEYEVEMLREAAARDAQHDRLTGVLTREALLTALFRETDRVQRMSGALSLVLLDVDDFGHWNSRLGSAACDEILCQVAARTGRLLRSYDLLGRTGKDEFLVALPGCTLSNASSLAERLCAEVFATPFRSGNESIRLSACYGIAHSQGRSPVVVLREAEQALQRAKQRGPESIHCFGEREEQQRSPVTFLSGTSGEELLAW